MVARRTVMVIAVVNFVLAIGALTVSGQGSGAALPSGPAAMATVAIGAPPVLVEVGAARIAANVVPVGLNAQRAIVVPPFGTVGWYDASAAIGESGAVVLVGHVDSTKGPDVFFGLHTLVGGEVVTLTAADGSRTSYLVREKRLVAKTELPREIFRRDAAPGLWLITCGGHFDRAAHSYESNQLVYASPMEANAIA